LYKITPKLQALARLHFLQPWQSQGSWISFLSPWTRFRIVSGSSIWGG